MLRRMYEWLPPDVKLITDPSPADWIVTRLQPWGEDIVRVGAFMPDTFDGYVRILHPAGGRGGEHRGLRWSDLAGRLSRPLDPETQFTELADGDGYAHPILGDVAPLAGSLPLHALDALTRILEPWIEEGDDCWFAMWDGNGTWWKGAHGGDGRFDDERDGVLKATPRIRTQQRRYFLMRGPIRSVLGLFEAAGGHSPAMWWPERRSWLVSTEVDAYSSYLGGPSELIADLLRADELECLPSRLEAPLDWGL